MLNNIKKTCRYFKEYGIKFIYFVFEELIVFGNDFLEACKFMYKENKNQWWPAAKRNWWKLAKYFGVLFVFLGLELTLKTNIFLLVSFVVFKILNTTLPLLYKRIENAKKDEDVCGIPHIRKIYIILRVVQVLLPIIALYCSIAHWWLLCPGLFMMLIGGFMDYNNNKSKNNNKLEKPIQEKEKTIENEKRNENSNKDDQTFIQNEKENGNDKNVILEQLSNGIITNTSNISQLITELSLIGEFNKLKDGFEGFFGLKLEKNNKKIKQR